MDYQHQHCPYCGHKLTYEIDIDKGTVESLKTIAKFIKDKGINAVHLTKELLGDRLTNYQIGNIPKARFHGLVAKIKDHPGNYCLTTKGLDFLNGKDIPRSAIIKKAIKDSPAYTYGYGIETVSINSFLKNWDLYWASNGYNIKEGRVINKAPVNGQLF